MILPCLAFGYAKTPTLNARASGLAHNRRLQESQEEPLPNSGKADDPFERPDQFRLEMSTAQGDTCIVSGYSEADRITWGVGARAARLDLPLGPIAVEGGDPSCSYFGNLNVQCIVPR